MKMQNDDLTYEELDLDSICPVNVENSRYSLEDLNEADIDNIINSITLDNQNKGKFYQI